MVTKTPAFLKDSMQIIREVSEYEVEEDILLVKADVASLYTIIPHELGYKAAEFFLKKELTFKSVICQICHETAPVCHGAQLFLLWRSILFTVPEWPWGANMPPALLASSWPSGKMTNLFLWKSPPSPNAFFCGKEMWGH